jgi:hypothetical protein
MILVSIWSAKGEGRVSRDQKVGDDEYPVTADPAGRSMERPHVTGP